MKASSSIVEYLKQQEKFRSKAYKDGSKYAIGYGHQIKSTESNLKTIEVSLSWANTQLLKDIQPLENQINKCSKPVKDHQMFDALIEFGFNCGAGSLANALNVWKSGTKDSLCEYLLKYKYYTNDKGEKVVSSTLLARRQYDVDLINGSILPGDGILKAVLPVFLLGAFWFWSKR